MTKKPVADRTASYGWVIVACVFIFGLVDYGMRYSFSVFYVAILNEFKWSRAETAFIFSLSIMVYGLMAPLSGILADKIGPKRSIPIGAMLLSAGMVGCAMGRELWHFYVSFGVLFAIGNCIAGFSQHLPLIARWFARDSSKAIGITMAGGGGLCFFFSPLAEYLITIFGWRNAFIIMALAPVLLIMPLALIFIKWPEEKGLSSLGNSERTPAKKEQEDTESVHLGRVLKSTTFWLLFFTHLLVWGIGKDMLLAHTVAFMTDIGFNTLFSAFIFSSHGLLSALGNTSSSLANRFGKVKMFIAGSIITSLGLFILSTATISSPWKLYAWVILFGTGIGIVSPAMSGMAIDLFSGKYLGTINGFLIFGFAIGGCIGPYIAGYIFDVTKTYTLAFYLAITAFSVASVLVLVLSTITKKRL